MSTSIRVGAVSYLNAKPLYEHLPGISPQVEVVLDLPSRLAERLAAAELDVALIPSVEYFRGAGLGHRIIPGLAIAARGAVRSVRLFSRVPIPEIRRLALDAGSRTSQALVRVWLDASHGVRPPRIEEFPIGVPLRESTADAVLLIGDRAMTATDPTFPTVVDLAAAWKDLTGLPFVFALWVARAGIDLGRLPEDLRRSRDEGLAHAAELAAKYGPRLGLDVDGCYEYLTSVLSYDLGPTEILGLRRFAAMAARLGLVPEGVDLVFHRRLDLAARR